MTTPNDSRDDLTDRDRATVAAIDAELDGLRPAARLGTLAGELQHTLAVARLEIATIWRTLARSFEAGDLAGARAAFAAGRAAENERFEQLAQALADADPTDTTTRARSLWWRGEWPETPLGTIETPDGRRIEVVDERHAEGELRSGVEAFLIEPDATRRRALKVYLQQLLDLMAPGERGTRSADQSEDYPRLGVDAGTLRGVDRSVAAILDAREDRGRALPDVWMASGVDAPGFAGMPPSEVRARLIARRLGLAADTGYKRVLVLLRARRDNGSKRSSSIKSPNGSRSPFNCIGGVRPVPAGKTNPPRRKK